MINGSSVTARNEVYIVITEAIHSVPIVPSLPILNPRPTDTPISNNNIQSQETTTTKDPNINNVSEVKMFLSLAYYSSVVWGKGAFLLHFLPKL